MSGVPATFGGLCRAEAGGLALHFELESANNHYGLSLGVGLINFLMLVVDGLFTISSII